MMSESVGSPSCRLWLLGDSNPARWQNDIASPLDPRHPARHSIWTPVLDYAQDRLYRKSGLRLDTSLLYIRNAVANPALKPKNDQPNWPEPVLHSVGDLASLLQQFTPVVLISFGSFAFEAARRACHEQPARCVRYWTTSRLGDEFRLRSVPSPRASIVLPLLHASIARRHFLKSHTAFSGKGANYFETTGHAVADILLRYRQEPSLWVPRGG